MPISHFETLDDANLVQLARQGDEEAFGELMNRYWQTIGVLAYQKVGRMQDADDVAQETFIRAYKALGDLRDPHRFGAWVYHIGLRQCIDCLRARKRKQALSLDGLQERNVQFAEGEVPDFLELQEQNGELLRAVHSLPDNYRVVLTLRYYKGMAYREIAEHLGEPQGTISNRIFRGLRLLKDQMESTVKKES